MTDGAGEAGEADTAGAADVPGRLVAAFRSRDPDRLAGLFTEDYDSQQPAHPDRAFTGRDQVRANWAAIFSAVPDFTADLVAAAVDGDTAWTEWSWHGTRSGGSRLDMAGVVVLGVRDGLICWARLYVEDVDAGSGIDAAVQQIAGS